MYDKKKLKKLLNYPLDNFNKLVKIYIISLLDYFRHKYGLKDTKSETFEKLKKNISLIEDEFEVNPPLEPYIEIKDTLREIVLDYMAGKKIIPELASLKALVIYREKNKWGKIVFTNTNGKIVIYLPTENVLVSLINNIGLNTNSDIIITSSNNVSPYMPPNIIPPYGPNNPPNNPPYNPLYKLGMKLSLADQYKQLLDYIKYVLLDANKHLFHIFAYMDPGSLTYNDLNSMYVLVEKTYGPNNPSYNAKMQMIDYVFELYRSIITQLSKLNPYKSYEHPAIPISVVLNDALRYTNHYTVPIASDRYEFIY